MRRALVPFVFALMMAPLAHATPITSYETFQTSTASLTLTTIGFDSLAGGSILAGNEFAGSGLTITQRDGQPIRVAALGDGSFVSAANFNSGTQALSSSAVPGFSFGYDPSKSENYDFGFSAPQAAAGLWIGNINPQFNTISVQFLGSGNTILDSLAITTQTPNLVGGSNNFDNRVFVGLVSSSGIQAIRVNNAADDADGIVFDDIVFEAPPSPTTVPEPASILLLGSGLAGTLLGTRSRPRRR